MAENEYPKWVQRAPDIGAVLVQNAEEEKKLRDDWVSIKKDQEKEKADELKATEDGAETASNRRLDGTGTYETRKPARR